MKLCIATLFFVSIASSAFGADIYLRLGESYSTGGDQIICGGGPQQEDYYCECTFRPYSSPGDCRQGYYEPVLVNVSSTGRERRTTIGSLYSVCRSANAARMCQDFIERDPRCQF